MSRVTGTGPRPGPWVQVYKLLYPDKYHEYGYNGQGYYNIVQVC